MYYIEISTSLFRDLDIVIRDLDLLIYSNSISRIVFLIYYFFSMSLIRFRTILIYVALIYFVQFGMTDILYVTECKINYGHHGLMLFDTLTDTTVSQACQHATSQSLLS